MNLLREESDRWIQREECFVDSADRSTSFLIVKYFMIGKPQVAIKGFKFSAAAK